MNRHAWLFAFFTAAIALPAACTFPDVTFGPSGSSSSGSGANGGGSSTTRSTTSNGGNASTQNTGGTGQGGAGGAGGQGNNGGASTTSAGGSAGGGGPCPMAADPCDCDGDDYRRPNCGDGSKPETDCNDNDNRVHPGQTMYFTSHANGSDPTDFDFDCDGSSTPKWPKNVCNGLNGCNTTEGWSGSTVPDCGQTGDLYDKCTGLSCTGAEDLGDTKQPCR